MKRRPTEEERQAEVEQLTDALQAKVVELTSSDEWLRMLELAGRFHRYSWRNQLLLLLQAENSVAFAPDGHTLATASDDKTVLLWDLTGINVLRERSMERACSLTRRGLDSVEWARYVPNLAYLDSCAK